MPRHEVTRVVEKRRGARRRFGEVVVGQGVAARAQVREVLVHPSRDAVGLLAELASPCRDMTRAISAAKTIIAGGRE